jgi:hypothetical protein
LAVWTWHLHERWNAGVTNASALFREIVEQGDRGRQGTVASYLAPFRKRAAAPPAVAIVPKVRQVASWMLRHPNDLDDKQQLQLKEARASGPHLDATAAHVSSLLKVIGWAVVLGFVLGLLVACRATEPVDAGSRDPRQPLTTTTRLAGHP